MADLRGDGENIMRVSRIIPDFISQSGNAIVQLDLRNYPNDAAASSSLRSFYSNIYNNKSRYTCKSKSYSSYNI